MGCKMCVKRYISFVDDIISVMLTYVNTCFICDLYIEAFIFLMTNYFKVGNFSFSKYVKEDFINVSSAKTSLTLSGEMPVFSDRKTRIL